MYSNTVNKDKIHTDDKVNIIVHLNETEKYEINVYRRMKWKMLYKVILEHINRNHKNICEVKIGRKYMVVMDEDKKPYYCVENEENLYVVKFRKNSFIGSGLYTILKYNP